MLRNIFPPKIYELMWKNTEGAGHATDDVSAHAHCMVDT